MALCSRVWPINEEAGMFPEGWKGWPDKKRFALVLTHDVDTSKGHDKCLDLAAIEERMGFRSSFNFVPERYKVSPALRESLVLRGFEVGVHGLNHDGKYYNSRKIFQDRAVKINRYLNEWKSVGFRSPSMHHNLEWIHDLEIEYDASTYDTDPFEPYGDGVGTIFPFLVTKGTKSEYIELPYTLPQDSTLFILMQENNIDIWKRKLDWIASKGGMALINVHPDYMNFEGETGQEEYPASHYSDLISYVKTEYKDQYWHVLCRDLARYWKNEVKPAPRVFYEE